MAVNEYVTFRADAAMVRGLCDAAGLHDRSVSAEVRAAVRAHLAALADALGRHDAGHIPGRREATAEQEPELA